MNEDDYIKADVRYDDRKYCLQIIVSAKKNVALTELQGFTKTLEQLGATMPEGFVKRQLGDGVEIPPEMEFDMKVMNQNEFRWGTEVQIKQGQTHVIAIQVTKKNDEPNVLTLVYSFPRLLGLLKGRGAIYVSFGATGDA